VSVLSDYSIDWQHLVVLLYALDHMTGDIPTRQRTMEYVQSEGFLDLRPEDYRPYPTCREPSWQTDIAWARKNAVMVGYINNHEWNSWEIARSGREFLSSVADRCARLDLTVSRCFLWSLRLKRLLTPGFTPSATDPAAPPKGERSMPSLEYYQALVEEKLRHATIEELAMRVSRALGVTIPATKPSVAFAYHLFVKTL
jgi:hypothetical protein